MSKTEEELIGRAIEGDTDALMALLSRVSTSVRVVVERAIPGRVQSLLSADDVLQQTYTDAFMSIGTFVPLGRGAFKAWLTAIARRNVIDAVRFLDAERRGGAARGTVRVGVQASWTTLAMQLSAGGASPAKLVAGDEAAEALKAAIGRLPAEYQTVIRMYDLEGCEMASAAAAIGRSRGAAYLMRQRAIAKLGELLGSGGDFLSVGP